MRWLKRNVMAIQSIVLNDLPDQDEEVRTEEIVSTDLVINNLQFSFEKKIKKIFDNFKFRS